MILPGQTIRSLCEPKEWREPMVSPFCERGVEGGMSYGLSVAGYDVRIAQDIYLQPGEFSLASTVEKFAIPIDILAKVADKSTWARRGLAVQNTIIEPGWCGFLTLELTNHGKEPLEIKAGMPIAQIIFHRLESPAEAIYKGKYQNQEAGPVAARFEK